MIRSNSPINRLPHHPLIRNFFCNFFYGLLLLGGLMPSLGGCFSRGEQNSGAAIATDQVVPNGSALKNQNTGAQIAVPSGWIASGSAQRGSADIYATYPPNQLYTIVMSEKAAGLSRFGLEDNAKTYRQLIHDRLDTFERETRTGIDTVGGNQALQYEIRGVVDGVPVVYLHTTIEGIDRYYQVVGWTTAERYPDYQETLKTITQSFQET